MAEPLTAVTSGVVWRRRRSSSVGGITDTSAPVLMRYRTFVTRSVTWNKRLDVVPKALAAFSAWPERFSQMHEADGDGDHVLCNGGLPTRVASKTWRPVAGVTVALVC